mgnify:CR=1 FL=1
MGVSEAQWRLLKARIGQRWARLKNDVLEPLRDAPDMLVGKLQQRYRISREEAERECAAFWKEVNRQLNLD